MKHLGDITKINGFDVPIVDIVCGGSPCQDLSVAGLRKGLQHSDLGNEETTRSGLFMEQIRIIKEMREHDRANKGADVDFRLLRPRFMVWENVPGAFSSNGGEDFRAVLEETAKVVERDACIPRIEGGQRWTPSGCIMGDGWSIAWRVHDAQFWGVPQRRKRIALVADFGGQSAPQILFERKSLFRDSEESGETRKGSANDSERSLGETISFQERAGCDGGAKESSYNMSEQEHCQHLTTKACCKGADMYNQSLTGDVTMSITGAATDSHHIPCVVESQGQLCYSLDEKMGNTYIGEDMGNTLSARDYKQPQAVFDTRGNGDGNTVLTLTGDNNRRVTKMTTCVVDTEAVCYRGDSITNPVNQSNPKVGDPCHTLTNDDRNYVVMAMQAIGEYKESDQASALKQRDYKDATDLVVYGLDRASFNQGQNALYDFSVEEEKAQTLVAKGPGGVLAKLSEHYAQEISRE